jgi:hypothetical protein
MTDDARNHEREDCQSTYFCPEPAETSPYAPEIFMSNKSAYYSAIYTWSLGFAFFLDFSWTVHTLQYSSHYLGTWCVSNITTADAHNSAASSRLN